MDKTLREKIENLANVAKVIFCKPLAEEEIQKIESRLQLLLPEEYKEFLKNFGCADGVGLEIMGRTTREGHILPSGEESMSALGRTLALREDFPKFPRNCIAIEYDGGDGYYCVVCGRNDYGKVVYWDMYLEPEQAYPNEPKPEWYEKHPNEPKVDFWVEAPDFWTYLIKRLRETMQKAKPDECKS